MKSIISENRNNLSNSSNDFGILLEGDKDLNVEPHKSCFSDCCFSFKNYFYNFHKPDCCWKRKEYILTDCQHFFHTKCLEMWMKQKLECPTCRSIIEYYQQ